MVQFSSQFHFASSSFQSETGKKYCNVHGIKAHVKHTLLTNQFYRLDKTWSNNYQSSFNENIQNTSIVHSIPPLDFVKLRWDATSTE